MVFKKLALPCGELRVDHPSRLTRRLLSRGLAPVAHCYFLAAPQVYSLLCVPVALSAEARQEPGCLPTCPQHGGEGAGSNNRM